MDKKISELDQALQINNDAVFPISQDNGGTDTTYKVSITQISAEVGEDQTFSNLNTTDKTLVGAINEVAQGGGGGGSSTLAGLSDVDIDDQTLSDGQVLKYDSAEDKWVNDDVGAGGHTIVADDGTDLTQRANLQFIGAYSEDNSVDDTTEVNVVRNMTKAQFDLLTADEKTGFINTTDETSQIYATEIPMSALDSDTVAEKLDEKVDTTDFDATNLPIQSGSATNTKSYIDNIAPQKYRFLGKMLDSGSSGTMEGIGTAEITLSNGIARIDFNLKITVADTTDRGTWGICRDYFTSLTGKTITPVIGGSVMFYKADGTVNDSLQGYAGCAGRIVTPDNKEYWKFGRIYKSGSNPDTYATGTWGNNLFAVNQFITGVVFGIYT